VEQKEDDVHRLSIAGVERHSRAREGDGPERAIDRRMPPVEAADPLADPGRGQFLALHEGTHQLLGVGLGQVAGILDRAHNLADRCFFGRRD
jgi:hypothetical protein